MFLTLIKSDKILVYQSFNQLINCLLITYKVLYISICFYTLPFVI